MEYSRESLDRIKKVQALKDADIIPYANRFENKQDIADIINISKTDTEGGHLRDIENLMAGGCIGEFRTAGRLTSYRSFGKLSFGKLLDHSSEIQISFVKDLVDFNTGRKIISKTETIEIDKIERNPFKIIEKLVDTGDYIGINGDLFITKHGELTLFVKEFQILAKAVRPLPEKFHGITDQETIYRQRYLDLITNQESYDRMLFRSKFIKSLRDFYIKEGFVEITTPILGNNASGAAAQPFITKHNDFGSDVVLRIAPEVGLKMATVGRFEKVFEFGPNFRNEGSDPSHLQEFNVVEHYAAWWNFEDNIKFTENMFDYIFTEHKLDRKIAVKDKEGVEKIADFTTPFERIDYIEGVNKASGLNILDYKIGDEKKLISDIKSKGIDFEGMEKMAVPTLIDYLYKKVLRPSIVGPAFVYNYPKALQPLARQNDENPEIAEQFQLVINGWEVNKAYSELVDPKIQTENFIAQSGAIELGDEEATQGDDDFILAMEYGMPCQSGFGMGFDRIISILTGQENLRDVVLFPLMKSEKKKSDKEIKTEKWNKLREAVEAFGSESAMEKLNKVYGDK
ncbi:MAG: lysine--tRNA ligase [Candidatus Gracilibacteria bacterium]|nr:lysine--tRNA ligase [Candidatus Gracilibacteria bacterium]MDQ7023321.1 lysine--tRNA ligase [Candidatus Gracilibacteria bacterium]